MPLAPKEAQKLMELIAEVRKAENDEGVAAGLGKRKRYDKLHKKTNAWCFTMYQHIRSITK